ncbi:MAG: transglycosylase domain-containing protein, partial [Desulfobulbaceae bacterium]|nr:transglycosylase domain-containing protein [Desulfobulbaceae bacterium]
MISIIKKLLVFSVVLSLLGLCSAFGILYWLVVVDPGPEIQESYIETILARESPVLYSNGDDPIGVLFQDTHRRYLPFNAIPKMFINAITAAEDNQFFHHYGIDIPSIARAMYANIKAGRIVQGGSTITQQTAKNLFKRQSRTFGAKLKELLFALRLEYHYPKEKILEFYCNQFFVSGNGHGLGVAARYYFDKEVEELSLTELAFIAGSVKSPNTFNPFTKKNRASSQTARDRAKDRTAYVLRKMYEQGMISQKEMDSGLQEEIVFKSGKMSYSLNSIIDSVKDALGSTSVTEAMEAQGISNVSTSGIRIITSIDKNIQEKTLLALRRELSRLDVRMRGYNRQEVQQEYRSLEYPGDTELLVGSFVFGTISNIREQKNGGPLIDVLLDVKNQQGILDVEGLTSMVTAHTKWREQRWSSPDRDDLHLLLAELQIGDRVFVHLRSIEDNGKILLDLERFSEMEGAALVTRKGMVKAMVGGMENRYFNRAMDAKRSMGSVFKPFLFAAALQLGWNNTDPLDNRRNVFVFQGKPYFPRPDHHSPYNEVSMAWAGVNSENVAAVWLLYHLLDHLSPQHLRDIATRLDMAPRTNQQGTIESYNHFKARIRDDHGIVVDEDTIRRAAFERAVSTLEADFLFDQRIDEYKQLLHCSYGQDFQNFIEQINLELADGNLDQKQRNELLLRKRILSTNFLSLRRALQALRAHQIYYEAMLRSGESTTPGYQTSQPSLPQNGFFFLNAQHHLVFTLEPPGSDNVRELLSPLDIYTQLQGFEPDKRADYWQSILLGGHFSVYTVSEVNRQYESELEQLRALPPYSMEVLCYVRDYLITTGLQYLRGLARETGIFSKLDPVLSFPLGSNVVSLFETVGMYETLILGNRYY